MPKILPLEMRTGMRVPYALRRVPETSFACLLECPESPQVGDIVLGRVERTGRNPRIELVSGRNADLREGDLLAVVFGNCYSTEQFEGYARRRGDSCDLLSAGGLCGVMQSRNESVQEPSRLRLLGALGDARGRRLRLRDFPLAPVSPAGAPQVAVVCGTSMDSGKTYTASCLVTGLHRGGRRVAAIKLTGTAAGRDTWSLLDAGANPALDFIDGGWPSTYLCTQGELLDLYGLLLGNAAAHGADWVVVEIADGLFQQETAALLRSPAFVETVAAWLFAATDALGAEAGVRTLRGWDIEPLALSGRMSMSPLAMREAAAATGVGCVTARALQQGILNERFPERRAMPERRAE